MNGHVQGIGLRPAVARWAEKLELTGTISNTNRGVEIFIQGPTDQVQLFIDQIFDHLPVGAHIEQCIQSEEKEQILSSFSITESLNSNALTTHVPPDVAVCEECLAEIGDPEARRYRYPFTSCTNCGPRYSIIQAMPYERASTSMREFPLCFSCQAEYKSAKDRRFHAQTNACPDCGPEVWSTTSSGERVASHQQAISTAVAAIRQGHVVAFRGLGGYQLLVDATSEVAVNRLRQRKQRIGKPLAVMVDSLATAEQYGTLSELERATLGSRAAPIVLVHARSENGLASSINPGLKTVGLMLPTTPLHALLLQQCQLPLVVTSANREGEPIIYQQSNRSTDNMSIADLWLDHNREIEHPVDDSVIRCIAGRAVTIRLGRGLAPLPLKLNSDHLRIGLGGHQKTAVSISNGHQSILGPHIGDLDSLLTCERYQNQMSS
ncbi:MAG: carbamoyltransferase HypF [Planctomycetaceae bacterium]